MEQWGRGGEAGKSTSHSPSGSCHLQKVQAPQTNRGPAWGEAGTRAPLLLNTKNQSKVLPRDLPTRRKCFQLPREGLGSDYRNPCGAQGTAQIGRLPS